MRLSIFIIFLTLLFSPSSAQYKTEYGDDISPRDTIFSLNIFINIVYDLCDTCDPCNKPTPNWKPGDTSILNDSPPVYLANFIDREFDPDDIKGSFTKRFAEASFNNFILLGDFININLPQSQITPVYTGNGFSQTQMMNAAIDLINEKGGLKTIYGHDSIQHYDGFLNATNRFRPKSPGVPNGDIDLLQIFVRNSSDHFGHLQGGGNADVSIGKSLLINGYPHSFDKKTIQGAIKDFDMANPPRNATEIHELAHHLIGMSNSAHMGGGHPVNRGDLVTLQFNHGGWSLIGSSGSSLVSCNGFERWRLNWHGPDNPDYRIACQNAISDLVQDISGPPKTFLLRDFVTTGDAIRIRLPYTDPGALPQFIWLENHQIHNNGKEDYPAFGELECKDDGVPGIYAYYQVGKNDTSGSYSNMMPSLTDHLIPISAEGNWDIRLLDEKRLTYCVYWNPDSTPIQEYVRENPLSGYNDLMNHYFNSTINNIIDWKKDREEGYIKKKNGIVTEKLDAMGDNLDPFTDNTYLSLGANPAPVNVVTYHHTRNNAGLITKSSVHTDNRRIHLSGLKIDFTEQTGGVMQVDVRWDYYDVENSVLWTGGIVLHEKVNLLSGNKITIDQNQTPNRHTRNAVTGLFADPSYFICLDNSEFILQAESEIELKNLSSFILKSGSRLEINDNALFSLKKECSFVVQEGAELIVKGRGRINIAKGAYLCIEPGANIILQDLESIIYLNRGFIPGINEDVLSGYSCASNPADYSILGKGRIKVTKK